MAPTKKKGSQLAPPADVRARQARTARLVAHGATYEEAAKAEGYANESSARAAVKAHFKWAATEDLETMRPLLLDRGELLFRSAIRNMNAAERRTKILPDGTEVADPDQEAWGRAHLAALRSCNYLARVAGILRDGPQVQVSVGVSAQMTGLLEEWQQRAQAAGVLAQPVVDAETVEDPRER